MIYLSAQPDSVYFMWQLEIQLRNFHSLRIKRDSIHVLIGYDKEFGVRKDLEGFIDSNCTFAKFFCYPDLRKSPKYTSSIRPNLLKQHFEAYPSLENEVLFYHDSDVLFSRIPQIIGVEGNTTCYVSNTRNYLDMDYITRSGSEDLLNKMLSIVGLGRDVLEREDRNTGGAQYILKNMTADFWQKVEEDSEALYTLITEYNTRLWEQEYAIKKEFRSKQRGVQAWCADMWALLWNLWYFNKKVEIHSELDFSWPYSPREDWVRLAIQHYSGRIEEGDIYFKKDEYLNYVPWYDRSLKKIPNSSCSYEIIRFINKRKEELDNERANFFNSCIVIEAEEFSEQLLETYELIKTYVTKYLNVGVLLFVLKNLESPSNEDILTKENFLHLVNAHPLRKILWLPIDKLIDTQRIAEILSKDLHEKQIQQINARRIYKIDRLFIESFSKILNEELFYQNLGKFNFERQADEKPIYFTQIRSICEVSLLAEFLFDKSYSDSLRIHTMDIDLVAFDLT